MECASIIIVHTLPNRIRVKISEPIKNIENFQSIFTKVSGIECFKYNNITKSILIYFNPIYVGMDELIVNLALIFSKENRLKPIKIIYNYPKKGMSNLAYYSLISILVAGVYKIASPTKTAENLLNWIAVGSTVAAIGKHALVEISEKGSFDPEIVSVMYLINSINKDNFIEASAVTWLAAFGRHLIDFSYDQVTLQFRELRDTYTEEVYYDVSLLRGNQAYDKKDFMETLISKVMESENKGFCDVKNVFCGKGLKPQNGQAFFRLKANKKGFQYI
ncbi:hypothetical protein CLOACE_13000 [Clostridium acetireducens DSM 10703]|uniref:Uncharacterized protein n=1 Tax=Clostridium acetireducens DSM 10703 TaxID=1121290 RepID=A0A1E8EZA4_9CLOT|nr:hypothetical protein [Clostridium acetireducens]OFI06045.1 hypothetical protein CLOACE_13000 [Clostridium acetireducens DSM 10703]